MAIRLIRFVTQLDHLIDDIENGFKLTDHPTKFKCSPTDTIINLIDYWNENNLSNDFIAEVSQMYHSAPTINHFYGALATRLENDSTFNFTFCYYSSTIREIKFKMKCFTELRDNQKLSYYHTGFFGRYGISLNIDWAKKNQADRVIYVGSESEVSLRLAKILGVCVTNGKRVAMNFVFDLLSFVEIADNYSEFEWRIVGNHNYAGIPNQDFPNIIPFCLTDISEIFVNEVSEVDKILKALKKKQEIEQTKSLPKICLTEDIVLTEEDEKIINEIKKRN